MKENERREKFMAEALADARQALEAGEFPVGCVLVADNRIIARGRRQNCASGPIVELDHAEIVALRTLAATGNTTDMGRVTVYSTLEPCLMCYAALLLNGIRSFVYAYEDAMGGGTTLNLDSLPPLYREMQPAVTGGVLRDESILLFNSFFRAPGNTYLQDTLLARYTLQQADIA